ncbi:hypothetical protein [Rhodoglobus aureus]|uniref:hypothetical protein n=1 Tax=Rhodoglobus aureus TaxID=191497 RepID=UPI0031E4503C
MTEFVHHHTRNHGVRLRERDCGILVGGLNNGIAGEGIETKVERSRTIAGDLNARAGSRFTLR